MITLKAWLYIIPGALTPVLALLSSSAPVDLRSILIMIIGGIVGGCVALKAYLSSPSGESR